jgi:hypothetical protein
MNLVIAIRLNEAWHSRLPKIGNGMNCEAYGAVFDNRYYAIALWSSPVARLLNNRGMWELRRMAISHDAPKNTGSRMLSVMASIIRKEYPSIKILISYQDTDVHTGTIYKAAGWTATARNKEGSWNRPNRYRPAAQSTSPKIRWEKSL